jgi:hypothetical protein
MWRVVVCDQETSKTRKLKPVAGLWKIQPQWVVTPGKQTHKQTNKQISFMQENINFDLKATPSKCNLLSPKIFITTCLHHPKSGFTFLALDL